jgi:hypothetical protein
LFCEIKKGKKKKKKKKRRKEEKKKKRKEKKKTQKSREGFVIRGRKVYEPDDFGIVRHVCCLL